MNVTFLVEKIDELISGGIEGPWQRNSSGFNSNWATAGIFKLQMEGQGSVVLELFQSAGGLDCLVRVYQEEPLTIHFAKRASSDEVVRSILKQARLVYEIQPGRGEEADGKLASFEELELPDDAPDTPEFRELIAETNTGLRELHGSLASGILNPVPPPFSWEEIPSEEN